MTNLPRELRDHLAQNFRLRCLETAQRQQSQDGTRKFLFSLRDQNTIEGVIIPMERHATFCLSSQVGCRMACRFCATARGGLVRDLRCAEILEQVIHLRQDLADQPLTRHGKRKFNLVFMGMGEPLDNWQQVSSAIRVLIAQNGFGLSARRITVSTSGDVEHLQKLLDFPHPIGLTLSVGGATQRMRRRLMPVAGRSSLAESLELAEKFVSRSGRIATIAYVLIAGISDSIEEARSLAHLVRKRPFKVNLIPLNGFDAAGLSRPDQQWIARFQRELIEAGVQAFIRESGGQDIDAACGQLRRRILPAAS
jgi:23S rRNA (adenine2503-C2)-methyltransferase